jgi:hypothetical protein
MMATKCLLNGILHAKLSSGYPTLLSNKFTYFIVLLDKIN